MKLLVTDYDGTLFIDEDDLKRNIKNIKNWQDKGNIFMISTGRSYASIKNQIDMYNIPYDYLSCADGSIIYDKDDNVLEMYVMDSKIIEPYVNFYQKIDYEEIQFSYPRTYSNILLNEKELLGINICLNTENYSEEIVNDFIKMSKQYPEFHFLNYKHTYFSYLCVKPKGIDKSATVTYLKNKLNLNDNDIFVIGDSHNDIEMIETYHGVCIENSYPEITEISKKVYKSVSDYIEDSIN